MALIDLYIRWKYRFDEVNVEQLTVAVHACGCACAQRAAMTQSALSKERRELREQQQRTLLEAIPKDLSRPWEDPAA